MAPKCRARDTWPGGLPGVQPAARLTPMPVREHRRSARARRRSVLLLTLLGAALALLLVLLFTVGPFGSHLQRPGKPPLGYLRQPLGGRRYRVAAWTLGNAASLTAAVAALERAPEDARALNVVEHLLDVEGVRRDAAMVLATVIPHIHPDPVPRRMMV